MNYHIIFSSFDLKYVSEIDQYRMDFTISDRFRKNAIIASTCKRVYAFED